VLPLAATKPMHATERGRVGGGGGGGGGRGGPGGLGPLGLLQIWHSAFLLLQPLQLLHTPAHEQLRVLPAPPVQLQKGGRNLAHGTACTGRSVVVAVAAAVVACCCAVVVVSTLAVKFVVVAA
jgi:hypothetical protein